MMERHRSSDRGMAVHKLKVKEVKIKEAMRKLSK